MKQALQVINELEQEGLIGRHAIGGAMALLFHDEPVATYDLDVFCVLPQSGLLVDLAPVYAALEARGFKAEGEAVRREASRVNRSKDASGRESIRPVRLRA